MHTLQTHSDATPATEDETTEPIHHAQWLAAAVTALAVTAVLLASGLAVAMSLS
jgi:hypothetical protein